MRTECKKARRISPWLLLYLVQLLVCSNKCNSFILEGNETEPGTEIESMCPCEDCKCNLAEKIPTPEGSPKTLVSAGKRTVTSSGGSAPMLIDGKYCDSTPWQPGKALPAWVAIEVGGGICELLLYWVASENSNYDLPSQPNLQHGAPVSYNIETSADSTNGSDGTWTIVKHINNNTLTARSHSIHFCNQRWLRFVVLDDSYTYSGVQIHEIELHDNSDRRINGWLFFGDSITVNAFNRKESQNPAFSTLIWEANSGYYPMQINGGHNGDSALVAINRLIQALDENDGINVVAICLGTNDASTLSRDRELYRNAMRAMVIEVQKRDKIAIIPRVPWSTYTYLTSRDKLAMAQIVDDLRKEFKLPAGPDLFTFFKNNPHLLLDAVHPNEEGNREINRLWAEAALLIPEF